MWKARVGPEFPVSQLPQNKTALDYWKGLPRFHVTRCDGFNTIPIVQWYTPRDGHFQLWDSGMAEMYRQVQKTPWAKRIP